jgi:hypothetical protein
VYQGVTNPNQNNKTIQFLKERHKSDRRLSPQQAHTAEKKKEKSYQVSLEAVRRGTGPLDLSVACHYQEASFDKGGGRDSELRSVMQRVARSSDGDVPVVKGVSEGGSAKEG